MRPIRKKPTPTQPLDIRLRGLLPIISEDDARRIDRICRIVAKPSLSPKDFADLKRDLIQLAPALLMVKAWYKALEAIAADLGRDMATLRRLVGPGRPQNTRETQNSLRADPDRSTAGLPPANKSITSQCQAAAEEIHGRRIRSTIREESREEFQARIIREARAKYSQGEAGADPEDVQFVVQLARVFRIAPSVLLDAMNAQ
jgi:hypothetical protein